MKELGFPLTKRESDAFFRAADANHDGRLSATEFVAVLRDFGQVRSA